MRKNERILVIFNMSSGTFSKVGAISIIFQKLCKHFNTVSLINSNSPSQGAELARQALDQFDIIAAFGGDGTINSVASALVNTGKTLGILPGGSGNGLARNLNIPVSWRRALDTLIDGKDITFDSGRINNRFFLNVAGIGLDGLIARKFNEETKARGLAAYMYHFIRSYAEMPIFPVDIVTGGVTTSVDIVITAFANFREYGNKAIIAPFASPIDRLLDICVISRFNRITDSIYIKNLFTGKINRVPFYKTMHFDNCEIISRCGGIPFHFDGEYGGEDPERFKINVLPESIKIRVPVLHQ